MFDFFKGQDKSPKKDPEKVKAQTDDQPESESIESPLTTEPQAASVDSLNEPKEPLDASTSKADSPIAADPKSPANPASPPPETQKKGWFGRLKSRLTGGDKTEDKDAKSSDKALNESKEDGSSQLSADGLGAGPLASAVLAEEPKATLTEEPKAPLAEEAAPPTVAPLATKEQEAQAFDQEISAKVSQGEPLSLAAAVVPSPAESKSSVEPPSPAESKSSVEKPSPPKESLTSAEPLSSAEDKVAKEEEGAIEEKPKLGFLARLKQKLVNTRDKIAGRLEKVLAATKEINEEVLEELEEILITSDLGVKTTEDLLEWIRIKVSRKELKDAEALKEALRVRLKEIIDLPLKASPSVKPKVIMVVGINGVGKTTTIAKLAKRSINEGRSVLLAAGDTFRAAAVEQLTIWAKRVGAEIVSQPTGADPSAVVFDALTAAKSRGVDLVFIDTAGRLHTKVNLMEELKKIKRVANKACPGSPHETILVLDANTGQNAANQARTFHEAIGVDSLIVTKLDGTSKGGVVVSIINELKLPVTFIGLGETYDDLRPFAAAEFAEAILGSKENG
ncbi:MAG: signal recognition particle-docking protein FtsY [Deltaproteobacteria bacterium]|jgi:fused signal recognition particle receptor|nr:signal recognition particle-docking protein FtsY [Deltaproteobacteria bacterium]